MNQRELYRFRFWATTVASWMNEHYASSPNHAICIAVRLLESYGEGEVVITQSNIPGWYHHIRLERKSTERWDSKEGF